MNQYDISYLADITLNSIPLMLLFRSINNNVMTNEQSQHPVR